MSEKKTISIKDFNLFCDVIRSLTKIVDSAKFMLDENGLQIYGARNKIARCELTTNSIYSKDKIDFSILDMNMFVKILSTVQSVQENDFTDFKFIVDLPFIRFESKKFKTKLTTCTEDVISKWISTKIKADLKPIFTFKTSHDMIKRLNSHSYISQDPASLRIYLETKKDMENNALFATLGNKETTLNNELTLKLGMVTFGQISDDRKVILDFERMNLFDSYASNDIEISLMNMNVLVSKLKVSGKNDSYFNLNIYNTILKS